MMPMAKMGGAEVSLPQEAFDPTLFWATLNSPVSLPPRSGVQHVAAALQAQDVNCALLVANLPEVNGNLDDSVVQELFGAEANPNHVAILHKAFAWAFSRRAVLQKYRDGTLLPTISLSNTEPPEESQGLQAQDGHGFRPEPAELKATRARIKRLRCAVPRLEVPAKCEGVSLHDAEEKLMSEALDRAETFFFATGSGAHVRVIVCIYGGNV